MADSFVDKLRLGNILGNLQTPNVNQGPNPDAVSSILARAIPILDLRRQKDAELQQAIQGHAQAANDLAAHNAAVNASMNRPQTGATGGMNVVYQPDMSEYQRGNLALNRDKINQANDLGQQRVDISRGDTDIRQQRADTYDYNSKNPLQKALVSKGGDFTAFNPRTGETTDTGTSTGTLSDADRLKNTNINQSALETQRGNQKLAEIQAQADNKPTKPITTSPNNMVLMWSPDGKTQGYVPATRVQDAVKAGGKLVQ